MKKCSRSGEYSHGCRVSKNVKQSTKTDKIALCRIGRLSRFTMNPSRPAWKHNDTRGDSSFMSGWNGLFSCLGGAIAWASKKKTCITGSTMESEFVALAAAGKEAE
ncbi:hypothetical protein Tco_0779512 [Tanacetum coccineum]